MKQKRRPARGGVDLLAGDRHRNSNHLAERPQIPDLAAYQAQRLVHLHAVRPELAAMVAALAFGGAA